MNVRTAPNPRDHKEIPRPPGIRPLATAVLVAVAVGVVVAVVTLLRFDELLATAHAANPGEDPGSQMTTLWSRIGVAAAAAIVWPLLLRRLARGNARVYARIQRVSVIAAAALVAVVFLGAAPAWLRALQLVQAAAQLGVFAMTLRPDLRAWYAEHRVPPQCPRPWRPILLLVVLAPMIAEVTIGNLPFSGVGLLAAAFTVPIYGAGALLIRELARRVGGGWPVILGLGVGYFLIEEGAGLQSIFSPTLYHAADLGVRVAGINLAFALLQAVNHAVWSVAVPIALTELTFPETRPHRWLARPGLIVTAVLYVAGAALMVLVHLQSDPGFFAPAPYLIGAAVLAVLVGVFALTVLSRLRGHERTGPVPAPFAVGAVAFLAAFAFLAVLNVPGREHLVSNVGGLVPMVVGLAIVGAVALLVVRWSSRPMWTDVHLLALCGGSVLGHSLMWGLILPTTWATRTGVIVLFVLSAALLARMYRQRSAATPVVA